MIGLRCCHSNVQHGLLEGARKKAAVKARHKRKTDQKAKYAQRDAKDEDDRSGRKLWLEQETHNVNEGNLNTFNLGFQRLICDRAVLNPPEASDAQLRSI